MALHDWEQDQQLAEVIAHARRQGIADQDIERQIGRELEYARLREPPPKPAATGLEAALAYPKDFFRGAVKGMTLGYADPGTGPVEHPYVETGGEIAGSLIPGMPLFKGAGFLLRGIKNPLLHALSTDALGGAAFGGLWNAPSVSDRLTSAAFGGLLTPVAGQAIRWGARLFGKKAPAEKPTLTEQESGRISEAQEILAKGTPDEKITRIIDLQKRGREPLGPEAPPTGERGLVPVETTPVKPFFTEGPLQRPLPTKPAGLLPEPTVDFHVTPGGSAVPRPMNPETQMVIERVLGRPPGPGQMADAATLENIAELKNFDLAKLPDGSFRLVGSGGRQLVLRTQDELQGFLATAPVVPKQPIEVKTPLEGEPVAGEPGASKPPAASTFDKIVTAGAEGTTPKLSKADRANLKAQRTQQDALDAVEKQADQTVKPAATVGDLLRGQAPETPDLPLQPAFSMSPGQISELLSKRLSDLPSDLREYFQIRADEELSKVASGEPGGKVFLDNPNAPGQEVIGYGSTYPKWYGEVGRKRKDILASLERLAKGEERTDLDRYLRRTVLWDEADFEKFKDWKTLPEMKPIAGGAEPKPGLAPWHEPAWASPIATPALHASPLVRQLATDGQRAEMAWMDELKNWRAWIEKNLLAPLGTDPDLRRKAILYTWGKIDAGEAGPKAVAAGQAARQAYGEFARRQGIPENPLYATHLADFNGLYGTFRDRFLKSRSVNELGLEDAKEVPLRMAMDQQTFDRLRGVMLKNPTWESVPKNIRTELLELWNFDNRVGKWQDLPDFIKAKLPEELFSPFLLPRKGRFPYVEDLVEAFAAYVPRTLKKIHFDPLLEKYQPIIQNMPGSEAVFTPKGYAKAFLERHVLNRPSWDERNLKAAAEAINQSLGKELFNLSQAHDAATLIRGGAYRGLLGPDSAIWNLSGSLNTVMESGRFWGPMGKYLRNRKEIQGYTGLLGDFTTIAREWERSQAAGKAASPLMEKVWKADDWLNRWALSPMAVTENFLRGHAALAGVEEALAKGYSGEKMLVNAMAKASDMVPNLELPEAWIKALTETVPRTQFGGALATQRSPFLQGPLGRLSSILLTYPTQQLHFFTRGFSDALGPKGFKALFPGEQVQDPYKLFRFTVGLGVFLGLPAIAATAGYNIRNQFGLQGALGNLSLPFWHMLYDGYQAVQGKDPVTREQAKEAFTKGLVHMQPVIPQTRFAEKLAKGYENIQKGAVTDAHGRFVAEATPLGELMKLAGPKPEAEYDTREMTKYLINQSLEHWMARQKAMDAFFQTRDPMVLQQYMRAWPGHPITTDDLVQQAKERQLPPHLRALQRFPKATRPRMLEAAQEEAAGY